MMRKSLFLVLALLVVGMTIIPQVYAQNNNQRLQQLQKEAEQLAAKYEKGQATQKDLERMGEIGIELIMLMYPGTTREQAIAIMQQGNDGGDQITPEQRRQLEEQERLMAEYERLSDPKYQEQLRQEEVKRQQQEEEQRRMYPGDTRGWPTAAMFKGWSLSNIKQPSKAASSYNYMEGGRLEIYITNANASMLKDLKKQLTSALGKLGNGQYITDDEYGWRFGEDDGRRIVHRLIHLEMEGTTIKITMSWGAA